jgi:hypothetical protein
MTLLSHWTKKGKTEKEKKSIKQLFENSGAFRELLGEILIDIKNRSEEGLDFNESGWPFKRAAIDGKIKAINEIEKLLMLDKIK